MQRKSLDLYLAAKKRIPGGTQLLSKRPEMFAPDVWPAYYSKAKGAEVWDLDGNKYIDMAYNGIGACILGAADPDVDAAVTEAITKGVMSTLNCPEEVELADLLCEIHPWASMVRYARCGGEAMAVAVRIARASTRRDKIAFCGYHGWHDWYLAANLAENSTLDGHLLPGLQPLGVPRGLLGTTFPFRYNKIEELEAIVAANQGELAAIVMEPQREHGPENDFLQKVKALAKKSGAVLIFDEVTSGFRINGGGIHLVHGVEPDMAVFAKALGNGYPIAAIIGTADVMQAAQDSFISSTNWTEKIGPTAALATIRKHQKHHVHDHLIRMGKLVKEGWKSAADKAGLSVEISSIDPLAHFTIKHASSDVHAPRTLFTQMMLDRGFLACASFYATFAHTDAHVASYIAACNEIFPVIAKALNDGAVMNLLKGPVAHAGFHRLT